MFIDIVEIIGCLLVFLPHYEPILNLAEWCFRDIKAIEIKKKVYGEREGLLSLCDSVESIKNKNYQSILKEIGYI